MSPSDVIQDRFIPNMPNRQPTKENRTKTFQNSINHHHKTEYLHHNQQPTLDPPHSRLHQRTSSPTACIRPPTPFMYMKNDSTYRYCNTVVIQCFLHSPAGSEEGGKNTRRRRGGGSDDMRPKKLPKVPTCKPRPCSNKEFFFCSLVPLFPLGLGINLRGNTPLL